MPNNMLGVTLREARGPLNDLYEKLASENGEEWLRELKRLNRKEPCWIPEFRFKPDFPPLMTEGYSVESHVPIDFVWDSSYVDLHLVEGQNEGINGKEMRERLQDQRVLNANVLDYLFANRHQIPKAWGGKIVFFWGTIYRKNDELYVRCLEGTGSRWWFFMLGGYTLHADYCFYNSHPAAILRS